MAIIEGILRVIILSWRFLRHPETHIVTLVELANSPNDIAGHFAGRHPSVSKRLPEQRQCRRPWRRSTVIAFQSDHAHTPIVLSQLLVDS